MPFRLALHTIAEGISRPRRSQGPVGRGSRHLGPEAPGPSLQENEIRHLGALNAEFAGVSEQQSQRLVDAFEHNVLRGGKRFQAVRPVLSMDLIGAYVSVPG